MISSNIPVHFGVPSTPLASLGGGLEEYLEKPVYSTSPEIHSPGEYFSNIGDSVRIGAHGGAGFGMLRTIEFVRDSLGSDGKTPMDRVFVACASVAGLVTCGIGGATAGLAMGMVGKNIGTVIPNKYVIAVDDPSL